MNKDITIGEISVMGEITMSTSVQRRERNAILITVFGNLLMAGLGLGFALATRSQAILLDGVYSLIGFGLAFLLAVWLPELGFPGWVPYVDPLVTALVCLLLLPIPYKIIRENWGQIVARSAPAERIAEIEAVLSDCLPPAIILQRELRVLESGRVLLVHLYLRVGELSIRECDEIRDALWEKLRQRYTHPALDVSFTSNPKWFRHASGEA